MLFFDRNCEDSRIFCHSGYAKSGHILRPEHSSIGYGRVEGKSRNHIQQDRDHQVGVCIRSK